MSYTPMFERWFVEEDGHELEVLLDLGRGEDYPLTDLPWFFGVRIPMVDRDDRGQATDTEARRLDMVERRVREVVRDRDGLYVGRRTGGGNRDLIFYMPSRPRSSEDRIRSSIGMEILFISHHDPAWAAYEQMLPGDREWRLIEDLKGIDALLNADAHPEAVHELEHRVQTSSPKGAEALARLFKKLELEDVDIRGERPELVVSGIQRAPLDHAKIHRVSWILDRKAPKARGEYLGWTSTPELEGPGGDDDPDDLDGLIDEGMNALLKALGGGEGEPSAH